MEWNRELIWSICDRFFWLALYVQPALWVGLAVFAIVKFEFIWLSLVGEYETSLQSSQANTEPDGLVLGLSAIHADFSPRQYSYCISPYHHEHRGVFAL